jgi:methyl-accepting chemotaxis protein
MSNNQSQRRTIFIDKAFQGRFILKMFLLILLSGFCSALLIYWLTGGDLQAQSYTAHTNIMTSLEHLGISILIGNLLAMLIAGSLVVVVALYASHKIAGPLYRFEKLCEQIGDGQLESIPSLREHDQLQELGKAFAEMASKLRYRKSKRILLINELANQLEQLRKEPSVANQYAGQLEKMQQTLEQLQE